MKKIFVIAMIVVSSYGGTYCYVNNAISQATEFATYIDTEYKLVIDKYLKIGKLDIEKQNILRQIMSVDIAIGEQK